MSRNSKIFCGLDVGSSKICVVVVRVHADGGLEVLSSGYCTSAGIRKGTVVDVEESAAALRKAREEAELRSGRPVDWVTIGIIGDHVEGYNCHGAIPIEGKSRGVTAEDVAQVIQAAQSIPLKPDREVIHVLTQEFILDNRGEIRNPVGLTGQRLDVNLHVVTCDSSLLQNLVNTVNRADMRVRKVFIQQLASTESVLSSDEKDLGAAVIDIGAGTTGIAIYGRNALRHTAFIPVGGENFTRDLAIGLRTPLEAAERIKRESGTVIVERIAADEVVEAPAVGSGEIRPLSRITACQILRDRAIELLELAREKMEQAGPTAQVVSGAVFTGGGSTLDGMVELAEEILRMPVRLGMPCGLMALSEELAHPSYAGAVGLAKLASQQGNDRKRPPNGSGSSTPLVQRFLSWVGN